MHLVGLSRLVRRAADARSKSVAVRVGWPWSRRKLLPPERESWHHPVRLSALVRHSVPGHRTGQDVRRKTASIARTVQHLIWAGAASRRLCETLVRRSAAFRRSYCLTARASHFCRRGCCARGQRQPQQHDNRTAQNVFTHCFPLTSQTDRLSSFDRCRQRKGPVSGCL